MRIAVCLLLALAVPAIYAQSCTVDKELNFPNLNLCGASQGEFCQSYEQRLGALEAPSSLCDGTEQAMCERLETVETTLAAPQMLCGVPVDEFCATTAMSQSDQTAPDVVNPAEIMCLASPVGEIRFFKLGATCPCGFADKTSDYENRFVSIGGATDFIGSTASGALGSRTTTVTSTLSGVTAQQQMWTTGRDTTVPLLTGQGPFTATGPVATADVAPSLALMVCERTGSCDCDV
jgi:hypothetical protein